MLYALSMDDRTLHTFSSVAEGLSYCEGWDVSSGNWKFFAADGGALEAVFCEPASRRGSIISHGKYSLRRVSGPALPDFLAALGLGASDA